MILFGEDALRVAVREFAHYHRQRNHRGIGNVLIVPTSALLIASAERSITMTGPHNQTGPLVRCRCSQRRANPSGTIILMSREKGRTTRVSAV
jgi:hypothetical protein